MRAKPKDGSQIIISSETIEYYIDGIENSIP